MKSIKTSPAGRAVSAALAVMAVVASAETVVFRPGYSEIVIETNACDTVRVAAEEARDFMGRALGYDVPIVAAPTPSRMALFLGPNRWADAAGVTTNGLKRDGFRIRTTANGVYVLGIDDPIVNAHRNRQRGGIWFQNFERATVFGVYDFLERFAGVRFYFPGELGTVVPRAAQDWTYQSFAFTAGEKTGEKGPSLLRLQIVNAKGEAWFDHVRIEELD